MISQIYIDKRDRIRCVHDGIVDGVDRFSVEVESDRDGALQRALLSLGQLRVLHQAVSDELNRQWTRESGRREIEADMRPVVAEAVTDIAEAPYNDFVRQMAAGFEPITPPEWAERNAPKEGF